MVGGVSGNGLMKQTNGKFFITSTAHRGATTEDLVDHARPVLRKKPHMLVVHGGTNDLTNGVDTLKQLKAMVALIKKESPSTKLVLSNIIKRNDGKVPDDDVEKANKVIADLCEKEENILLIDNKNIEKENLARAGLHLSGYYGSYLLAQNIWNFLNN